MTQPPLPHRHSLLQACEGNDACAVGAQGHGLSLIHQRLAWATSRKWVDAVVAVASSNGWLELRLVEDDSIVNIWNHGDLSASLAPGSPVSLHSVYDVLTDGDSSYNVVRLPDFG